MQPTLDTMTVIGAILSFFNLIFGLLGYQRSKSRVVLYIGITFGLFGLSHLAILLGLKATLNTPLIIIRTAAYFLVTYAIYLVAFQSKK